MLISQNVRLITPNEERLQLDYSIDRNNVISEPLSIRVQELYTSVKLLISSNLQLNIVTVQANGNISLHIAPCIAGYKLVNFSTQYSCTCNLDIKHILQCENDQVTILLNVRLTQHTMKSLHKSNTL